MQPQKHIKLKKRLRALLVVFFSGIVWAMEGRYLATGKYSVIFFSGFLSNKGGQFQIRKPSYTQPGVFSVYLDSPFLINFIPVNPFTP